MGEWEEPKPRRAVRHQYKWKEALAPCIERPGSWYKVGPTTRVTAGNLNAAARKTSYATLKLPPGRWEFVSRVEDAQGARPEDGLVWLYAKYLGEEEANDQG